MSGHSEDRLTALDELPVLEPPAGREAATLAAMAAAAKAQGRYRPAAARAHGRYRLAAAAGLVVLIGAAAWLSLSTPEDEAPANPDATLAATAGMDGAIDAGSAGANEADAAAAADEYYFELLAEAALLEQVLYELPPPRRVIRVSTAGTIAGLEDRIALLDAELIRATVESDAPEYRTALLRERVDAMSALVNVRYAQSRAFRF